MRNFTCINRILGPCHICAISGSQGKRGWWGGVWPEGKNSKVKFVIWWSLWITRPQVIKSLTGFVTPMSISGLSHSVSHHLSQRNNCFDPYNVCLFSCWRVSNLLARSILPDLTWSYVSFSCNLASTSHPSPCAQSSLIFRWPSPNHL